MQEKDPYKHTLRVRSCGILRTGEGIVLVNLRSPVTDSFIWTAPGGGVKAGESLKDTVEREFAEETGLIVKADDLILINELLEPPYHAIEFFFGVNLIQGELSKGNDPERTPDDQIIEKVEYIKEEELPELDIQPVSLKEILLRPGQKGATVIHAKVR